MEVNYQLVETLPSQWDEEICSLLRNYNHAENPRFFQLCELPEHAPRPLNVTALDEFGLVVGGLMAETQFAWLKVSIMVVAERVRRQGIGLQMVAFAETEAIARGCSRAYLDTMDYQAPEFYRALGYQLAGQLENWDSQGHTKFLFTKRLSGAGTQPRPDILQNQAPTPIAYCP